MMQDQTKDPVQTQFDHINQELVVLRNRQRLLEYQQTWLNLWRPFPQPNVARSNHLDLQPGRRRLVV